MAACPRFLARAAALVVACTATRAALAGGGAATDAYDGVRERTAVDVHALADVYLQLRDPPGQSVQLRAFDVHADRPSVDLLRVTLAHRPDWLGFRIDAGVGDTPDAFLRYDPAATAHPGQARALSYVEQAFVTADVGIGRGIAIDLGKFSTPVGLEDNEAISNWNYSRSLLFTLGEPTYHTGLRATTRVADDVALSAFWLNGWNTNLTAGNGLRSFAAAASWKPGSFDVEFVYAGGLERAPTHLSDPALSFRNELDASVVYELRRWISFAATSDYAVDARSGGVSWWGVGGYARCSVLSWLAGVVRGEHYADPQGFTTGSAQQVVEGTVTAEATAHLGPVTVIGRLEYRRDQSDEPVFTASERPLTHQDTSTLGLMAAY